MTHSNQPILYTFCRCPYAIRARLAITISQLSVEYREILLRDKPREMLKLSPKGTVPVLVLPDGQVIDESIDIMRWALAQNDPEHWLTDESDLIDINDHEFKPWLDRYKYADRHPEQSSDFHRQQGEVFLERLESKLHLHSALSGNNYTITDYAIAPFIRQFAHVDKHWFFNSAYPKTIQWLQHILTSDLFERVMMKQPVWKK